MAVLSGIRLWYLRKGLPNVLNHAVSTVVPAIKVGAMLALLLLPVFIRRGYIMSPAQL